MNRFIHALLRAIFLLVVPAAQLSLALANEAKPKVIVIRADDLGYGNLSCYRAEAISTPNIDRRTTEGAKFSSFYVCPVCSPTCASLMTGSHPARVGIGGVMFPRNNQGLNLEEIALPELANGQGYWTAIMAKWHLGNEDMFQPLNHGVDYWYGTLSSNSQFHYSTIKKYAADCVFRKGYTGDGIFKRGTGACPLVRVPIINEVPADQTQSTQLR